MPVRYRQTIPAHLAAVSQPPARWWLQVRGWRWTLGEVVSCPLCVGTWVAAEPVYGLHLAPRPTRAYIAVMSATGVAQVLSETTEALTWSSRAARRQASAQG